LEEKKEEEEKGINNKEKQRVIEVNRKRKNLRRGRTSIC